MNAFEWAFRKSTRIFSQQKNRRSLRCTDLRFVSDSARFSMVFARRGLIAGYGVPWMLSRIVGRANALDLLFSARTSDAAETQRLRLANRVLQEGFLDRVDEYALGPCGERESPFDEGDQTPGI